MYSNVSNLVRELRAYLRIGGSPLVEIDIKVRNCCSLV